MSLKRSSTSYCQ